MLLIPGKAVILTSTNDIEIEVGKVNKYRAYMTLDWYISVS